MRNQFVVYFLHFTYNNTAEKQNVKNKFKRKINSKKDDL
jgi:hypothetical protein